MSVSAVITGASQGIGEAIAMAFASQPGSRLFLLARNERALKAVAGRCLALGAHAEAIACDLTDEVAVAQATGDLADRGETPDLLINNAGRFVEQELFSTTAAEFRDALDANLTSAFLMTRALAPAMMERGHGTIFFMGSVASREGYPLCGSYCAAKHGLLGLARSVRLATQNAGLRVTTIMPGATESPSWSTSEVSKARLMPAEDIAQSVLSIYQLSSRSVVEEIVLRPVGGDL
ncbi:MAG: SDR family oxidoreductase [Myxococcales bacterium]|nr:SDR family oxidoreductase [Myxococcales bacterium]